MISCYRSSTGTALLAFPEAGREPTFLSFTYTYLIWVADHRLIHLLRVRHRLDDRASRHYLQDISVVGDLFYLSSIYLLFTTSDADTL